VSQAWASVQSLEEATERLEDLAKEVAAVNRQDMEDHLVVRGSAARAAWEESYQRMCEMQLQLRFALLMWGATASESHRLQAEALVEVVPRHVESSLGNGLPCLDSALVHATHDCIDRLEGVHCQELDEFLNKSQDNDMEIVCDGGLLYDVGEEIESRAKALQVEWEQVRGRLLHAWILDVNPAGQQLRQQAEDALRRVPWLERLE